MTVVLCDRRRNERWLSASYCSRRIVTDAAHIMGSCTDCRPPTTQCTRPSACMLYLAPPKWHQNCKIRRIDGRAWLWIHMTSLSSDGAADGPIWNDCIAPRPSPQEAAFVLNSYKSNLTAAMRITVNLFVQRTGCWSWICCSGMMLLRI